MKENQDYRKDTLPLYFTKKAPFGLVPYQKLVQDDYFHQFRGCDRSSRPKIFRPAE